VLGLVYLGPSSLSQEITSLSASSVVALREEEEEVVGVEVEVEGVEEEEREVRGGRVERVAVVWARVRPLSGRR